MLQLKAIDPPVWERFEKAARRQRRNPYDLIREYMQQCLEAWEDQRLDEEIGKQARAGGKRAKDAVKVVRQVHTSPPLLISGTAGVARPTNQQAGTLRVPARIPEMPRSRSERTTIYSQGERGWRAAAGRRCAW